MDLPGSGMSRDHIKCPRTLPQFSELCSMPAVAAIAAIAAADGRNMQSQGVQTTAQVTFPQDRTSTSTFNKFFAAPLHGWQDMIQLCQKQVLNQTINVPNYSQNNGTLGAQSSNFSFINSLCLPSTSQADTVKQEPDIQPKEEKNLDKESDILVRQQQTAAMIEYLQKLSPDMREAFELCVEQAKKEKTREEKVEPTQNNILNIPNIRNIYLQNGNNFANSDQITVTINPNDLNLQNEQEIENSLRHVLKVEQQVQIDLPKIEKKSKFRAKMGEIKVSFSYDGTTLYCCPECNLGLPDKADMEQHIQAHLQERKYQCKECGAMLKRKEHLDQHMRGHSNERPYKCDVCQKAFKRNEHLTRHTVIHSGNKDFPCNYCQKAFSRKDHLNKHLQTHLGIRKNKMKEDSYYVDQKDTTRVFDNTDFPVTPKQEVSHVLKDSLLLKQETFLQHMQNCSKNASLFASIKEHVMKDVNTFEQAQSSNTNENVRYLMPS
ncbi:uncharacterized protein LOC143897210 [Temnothorax americanus]|uniref:uncharacterized protein LOC143897210 n=1 Tax=Temnothorax americanus TaxID=1964332 RepID=UPI0040677B54